MTDRCNLRCSYCMPKTIFGAGYAFMERGQLLTYEEIAAITRVFAELGVDKVRLTGGEPLTRKNLDRLVSQLASIPGVRDLALTTNGVLLPGNAQALKDAGLTRVTISLDSLDDEIFQRMNDVGVPVERVLAGIDAAKLAGLSPLKLNCVVKRGVNDGGLVDLARRFRGTGSVVRFIEFMDVGTTNGWRMEDVVPSQEVVERIHAVFPVEPVEATRPGEVARRWRYLDGAGEIGLISSVTQPFCQSCTRARLSADGKLYTCLFAGVGLDLRALVRSGGSEASAVTDRLRSAISARWSDREDRYSEVRTRASPGLRVLGRPTGSTQERIEMSYIGG